ncbi:MAG: hypothetical protein ACREEP_19870 [Dongiaceae bacterium]
MTAAILTWLDKWLYSNEVFNNLSMGLSYQPEDEALVRLRDEALRYCDDYAPAAERESCRVYQSVITDRVFFAHPLTALIGLQTRALLNDPDGLARLHRISIEPPLIGAAIALPIWFFLTLALPRADRSPAAAFTFLLIFIGQSHDREFAPVPDLLRDAGGWLAPLAIIAVTVAFYLIASRMHRLDRLPVWAGRMFESRFVRLLFWVTLGLLAASLALPPVLNALLAPLAILALFAALVPLARRSSHLSPVVLAAVFGMLFAGVTSEPHWIARRLGTSASFATLIYIAVIGLVALRPQTRLVWALPLMAIFHLPLAALLGLATVIAEAVLGFRTRRISGLCHAAALSFVIGMAGIAYGFESAAFAPGSARASDVVELILNWPGLPPTLLSMALLGFFALIPLRQDADPNIALSRAGLLIFQGAGAALLSAAIQQHDTALLNAPGYAIFAKPADYLTPALFSAGILAILLTLRRLLEDSEHLARSTVQRHEPLMLLATVLLLISVAKLDLKPRNSYVPAPLYAWRYVISGQMHPQWCHLKTARFDDETYYLSKEDPTNAAIIYWSALKAKIRTDAGVFRPGEFTVKAVPDDPLGCG